MAEIQNFWKGFIWFLKLLYFFSSRHSSRLSTSHINSWYLRVGRPPKAGTLRNGGAAPRSAFFSRNTLSFEVGVRCGGPSLCSFVLTRILTWSTWKNKREAFPFPVLFFVKKGSQVFFCDIFHERIHRVTLVRWCYLRQNQGKQIFLRIIRYKILEPKCLHDDREILVLSIDWNPNVIFLYVQFLHVNFQKGIQSQVIFI